jgi:hypothetical protein
VRNAENIYLKTPEEERQCGRPMHNMEANIKIGHGDRKVLSNLYPEYLQIVYLESCWAKLRGEDNED